MKGSLLEGRHQSLVKCIARALATPIPAPRAAQTPIVRSTFRPMRLCHCVFSQESQMVTLEIALDFSRAVWIRTYLSHSHLINKTELITSTSGSVAWLNEIVYVNEFCYLQQYKIFTMIILDFHFGLFIGNKNNVKAYKSVGCCSWLEMRDVASLFTTLVLI